MANKTEYEKKTIRESIEMDRYSLETNIRSAVSYLLSIRKEAKAKGAIDDGYIDISTRRSYYDSTELDFSFHFTRLETDEEFDKRVAALEAAKITRRENAKRKKDEELELYKKLKAKYEKEA